MTDLTTGHAPTGPATTTAATAGLAPRTRVALGVAAVAGAVLAAVAVLGLDAVIGGEQLRGRSLRSATISEYVYTSGAWAFNLAVGVLALTSAGLLVALVGSGRVRALSPGSVLLALWVVGLAGIVAFPKHNWAVGPSTSGSLHRVASLVAFLAVPAAVLVIVRRRERRASRAAATAWWLNLGALAAVAVLVGAVVYGSVADASWWRVIPLGLVERGIVGFEVAAIAALGVWAASRPRRT